MNDLLSLSVYIKKWIIVFTVNKLILIYLTWFVLNFVNYKYNFFLKRNDVCLMPLSTVVCVFFFHVHSLWRLIPLEQLQFQGKDQRFCVLKRFLTSAKSFHRYFRMKHPACLTNQRLDSILRYFCNSHILIAGKKSELSIIKWPRNPMLNAVMTLWQRLGNFGQ